MAERLRAQVAALGIPCDERRVSVTISIGVYSSVPAPGDELSLYLRRADEALYKSKADGAKQGQLLGAPETGRKGMKDDHREHQGEEVGGRPDFVAATLENAGHSRKESGISRFELFQDESDPCCFVLLESYPQPRSAGRSQGDGPTTRSGRSSSSR